MPNSGRLGSGSTRANKVWHASSDGDPWDQSPPRRNYGAPGIRQTRWIAPAGPTPLTERVLSSTEDPGRTKTARTRVVRKTGMVAQNIPQSGILRRVVRNQATTGPRQYRAPIGPRPILDRRSPDGFAPWPTRTLLDTTQRASSFAERADEDSVR